MGSVLCFGFVVFDFSVFPFPFRARLGSVLGLRCARPARARFSPPASFRSARAPGRASARFGEGNAAATPRPAQTSPPPHPGRLAAFCFFFPSSRPRATVSAPHPAFFLIASVSLCAGRFSLRFVPLFPFAPCSVSYRFAPDVCAGFPGGAPPGPILARASIFF